MTSVYVLSELLLHKLPPDGSFVSNTTARTLLGRAAEQQVDAQVYREVIGALEREGHVRRGNGPGGSIGLAAPTPSVAISAPPELSEYQLMSSLQRYLEGRFWRRLSLPPEAHWKVLDTSEGGAQDGQWRRSDYTGVAITPGLRRETDVKLYTFELKNAAGGDVRAVYEAKAQTRGSHFGHLVWYVPEPNAYPRKLMDIERACQAEGIGLVLFSDAHSMDSWDYRIHPVEQSTTDTAIDEFLKARLDQQEMFTIKQLMARQ
jgi:hypothetical protein